MERLDDVVKDVKKHLLKGAIPDESYTAFVFQVGKAYGVFQSAKETLDDGFAIRYNLGLDEKISITRKRGMIHEYVCLDDTSLSTEIEQDIDAYEELYYQMEAYVMLNTIEYERLDHPQPTDFYQRQLFPFIDASLPEKLRDQPEGKRFCSAYFLFVMIISRMRDEGKIKLYLPATNQPEP